MQYGSSGGTSWTNITPLAGSLAPGRYHLIQEAVYIIEVTCTDAAGNTAKGTTTVRVAHDRGHAR